MRQIGRIEYVSARAATAALLTDTGIGVRSAASVRSTGLSVILSDKTQCFWSPLQLQRTCGNPDTDPATKLCDGAFLCIRQAALYV